MAIARRFLTERRLLFDGPVGVAMAGLLLIGSSFAARHQAGHPLNAAADVLLGLAGLALVARRLQPLVGLGLAAGATVLYLELGYAYGPIFLAPLLAIYATARWLPLNRSLPAWVLTELAMGAALLTSHPGHPSPSLAEVGWLGWLFVWLLVPWLAGLLVRSHQEGVGRGRAEEARRIAYEERLRVAREVHDVAGHGLAVINMQAGVALHVLDRRPEQARAALEAIKEASKDALDELRGTLAVFREEPGATSHRTAPGLEQLRTLCQAMREGGLPVDLELEGEPQAVPAAADLAAYRIVQEALTNALRHAGPARARVRVRHGERDLFVEITDTGRAQPGSAVRIGHGLSGMRERVAALGGSLEAGPRPEGGFRVLARLPLRRRR
jgi:signal transduction histidine kinase